MTDDVRDTAEARSAGAMLRAARERQGLHIAALAAAIKVPQAKLEALEAGRYDELTDATFVRALAQSVCRVLKIDAKPVLDLMPSARNTTLDHVQPVRRTPFHDRPGREEPSEPRLWHQPVFWIVAVLLVAAVGFVMWPQRPDAWSSWLARLPGFGGGEAAKPASAAATEAKPAVPMAPAPAPAAPASAPEAVATPAPVPAPTSPALTSPPVVTETVHSAPAPALAAPVDAPAGVAVVRASEPSWVEAHDARGNVLLSRTLQPGESVGLDGALPLKLVIGNATATEVMLRGKRVTLGQPNRDNVVKVELR
jgi:cytoskeleton protein RodZ